MNILQDKKQVNKLIILFTLTYMVSYITRINYGTIILEMERATKISRGLLSMALTGSFITYGIGQVISGFLGDKFSPKKLVSYGFIITILMNLLIPICQSPYQMLVVWCVNGFAQSLMWPPLVRLMTAILSDEDYKRASVRVSWGSSFGTIFVYLVSPFLIFVAGWKTVFILSAVAGIIMLFIWNKYSYEIEQEKKRDIKIINTKSGNMIFTPVMICIMIGVVLQGMLRDGVTTWMPTYISDTYNLSSVISILTGVILPVFGILSFQLASQIYRRVFNNPIMCAGVIFAFGFICATILYLLSDFSAVLSIILSALLTGAMHGVNLILICMIPPFFKKYGNVSTVSGIINSCTYIGSALSTYGIAVLSDGYGWDFTLLVWVFIALFGAVILLVNVKPWEQKFQNNSSCTATYRIIADEKIYAEVYANGNSTLVWNQAKWQDGEYARYIQKNGCGHCCTAMALNLNGIKITPHEEFSLCRKMWGEPRMGEPLFEDNFISASGIAQVIKSFGINATAYGVETGKSYEASVHIEQELKNGKQVILWSHPSENLIDNPFSSGDHYILAVGFTEEGKILIANSSNYVADQNGIQFTNRQTLEKVLMDDTRVTDYTWGRYNFNDAGSYVVIG